MNNKKFDAEYKTTHPSEYLWLKQHGIRYTFVKVENGITVWKYRKNKELGLALAGFWDMKDRNYSIESKY